MDRRQTVISTIVQAIVAINTVLMACGFTQFENITAETIYAIVSCVVMAVVWGYGVWKNHNFTVEAESATKLMTAMKETRKERQETVDEPLDSEVL